MAYILNDNKPYYLNCGKVFYCSISADRVTVDFKNPFVMPKNWKIDTIYTEDEIKAKLGIFLVEMWDEELQKVVKVSNKIFNTIPDRTVSEEKEESKAEAKDKKTVAKKAKK